MKYTEATTGRVFIIRLEDGEIIHETIEAFCRDKNIQRAYLQVVGGVDKDSILVVGPKDGRAKRIVPLTIKLDAPHETTGTGTIFPDADGQPLLHLHIACGRKDNPLTGCAQKGVKVWHVLEVILTEMLNDSAARKKDKTTGFKLLEP